MKYFSHGIDICKIAVKWFYGVMVSTQDFESCDPSLNLGRTWSILKQYIQLSYIVFPTRHVKAIACCF